jgi:hypothetical protein
MTKTYTWAFNASTIDPFCNVLRLSSPTDFAAVCIFKRSYDTYSAVVKGVDSTMLSNSVEEAAKLGINAYCDLNYSWGCFGNPKLPPLGY